MKQVYCENCRAYVDYKIIEEPMSQVLKGKSYTYIGKEAYCQQCHEEVYVGDINDYNLEALYTVYRKENHIVSLEMIREIPKKYDIGKRPLSLLLGWGELTFTRYYNGDMPTNQYSEILKKIYKDPLYYKELLEQNKENLKSDLAYNKSKKAVEQVIQQDKQHRRKINLVMDYLLDKCHDMTPLALQKALYYIQGFYYAFYQQFLFTEDCEAWVHGPVYRTIYYRYNNQFNPIEEDSYKKSVINKQIFSEEEQAILDSIIYHVCCYSGQTLEYFTHLEKPWLITRGDLEPTISSNRIISKDLIGEYFTKLKEIYQMSEPDDIRKYTQSRFEQLSVLKRN